MMQAVNNERKIFQKILSNSDHVAKAVECLLALKPREEKIIRMRYGILGEKINTLQSIASDFGVSRERIRQIEFKALRKLMHKKRLGNIFREVAEEMNPSSPPSKLSDLSAYGLIGMVVS